MSKKSNVEVDETLLQEIVSRGVPQNRGYVPPLPQSPQSHIVDDPEEVDPPPTQEPKRRVAKSKSQSYSEVYFSKVDFPARQLIYVSKETHKKLTDIIQVAGGRNTNLSSYLENIVLNHFEQNKETINGLYANNFKPPIE